MHKKTTQKARGGFSKVAPRAFADVAVKFRGNKEFWLGSAVLRRTRFLWLNRFYRDLYSVARLLAYFCADILPDANEVADGAVLVF